MRGRLFAGLLAGGVIAASLACGKGASPERRGGTADTAPAAAAAGEPEARTGLDALARARGVALKTALHDVHEALIAFYAENSRYPSDKRELESDPALAAAVAELEKAATGLTYKGDGGSFTLTVRRADGTPITLSGNNQRVPRKIPPAPDGPAGT